MKTDTCCGLCETTKLPLYGFIHPASLDEIWLCMTCSDKLVVDKPVMEVEFVDA